MSNTKKNILGICIDATDYDETANKVIAAAYARTALTVSALAVHGIMTGVFDRTHAYRLNKLDVVVPDGQPVRWALNYLYHTKLRDRVYGPTLMLRICERAAQEELPIYLFGSRAQVLEQLSKNLRSKFPSIIIAGAQPSCFKQLSLQEKQQLVDQIQSSGAAITFIGLGCPRQEVWAYEYREALKMPLIAVGAAYDFHAGLLAQAPAPLQNLGLEWAYRFLREPRRLWKRYFLLNPVYMSLLLLQIAKLKQFSPSEARPPEVELRYG
jgi:N-acetylglucosaminyldiphosphoundecaprenol N-acetyl-beta-D-mannosaminyltransferase